MQGTYYHWSKEETYTQLLWGAYYCIMMLNYGAALNFLIAGLNVIDETLEF